MALGCYPTFSVSPTDVRQLLTFINMSEIFLFFIIFLLRIAEHRRKNLRLMTLKTSVKCVKNLILDKLLSKIELLVALVEFFSSLVVIERVRQFLETPLGLEFVRVLMLFIIANSHSILSSINNHMSQLGSYFIELITK